MDDQLKILDSRLRGNDGGVGYFTAVPANAGIQNPEPYT
jgi:hypothetical protein